MLAHIFSFVNYFSQIILKFFLFGRRHGAAAREIPAIGVRIGARLRGGEVRARAQYLPVVIKYYIFLTKIRINVKILTPKKLPAGLPVAEELPRISYECRRCKGLTRISQAKGRSVLKFSGAAVRRLFFFRRSYAKDLRRA